MSRLIHLVNKDAPESKLEFKEYSIYNYDFSDIQISYPIRPYFNRIFKDKDKIMEEHSDVYDRYKSKTVPGSFNSLRKQDAVSYLISDRHATGFKVITSDKLLILPIIFRYKINELLILAEQIPHTHLINAIIKHCILYFNTYSINKCLIILYYYWFFKDNINDINTLTTNVCVDIEEIISILIDKALGIYKDFVTGPQVEALREALLNERLALEADTRPRSNTLNLRRN